MPERPEALQEMLKRCPSDKLGAQLDPPRGGQAVRLWKRVPTRFIDQVSKITGLTHKQLVTGRLEDETADSTESSVN